MLGAPKALCFTKPPHLDIETLQKKTEHTVLILIDKMLSTMKKKNQLKKKHELCLGYPRNHHPRGLVRVLGSHELEAAAL